MTSDLSIESYLRQTTAQSSYTNRVSQSISTFKEAANSKLEPINTDASEENAKKGLISSPSNVRIQNFLSLLEDYIANATGSRESKTSYDENGNPVTFFGGDGDDDVSGYGNFMAAGGRGNDRLSGYDNFFATGNDGNDQIYGYDNTQAYGGNGNDRISGYDNLRAYGGNGDDVIDGYDNVQAHGGSGNDRISGYDNLRALGGDGDDTIDAYDNATIDAGSGDDNVSVYGNANILLGEGDDYANAGANSSVDGGTGNDQIHVGINGTVSGGEGDDKIGAGENALVSGGTGDDLIRVGRNSTVLYNKGDGLDVVDSSSALSESTLQLGPDINVADLHIQRYGDNLVINVGDKGDGIVIRNATPGNTPKLSFHDGSELSGDDIAAMAQVADGPPSDRLAAAFASEGVGRRPSLLPPDFKLVTSIPNIEGPISMGSKSTAA